jgi:transposase
MTLPNKTEALREEGTLNPRPETVTDAKFRSGQFFDPLDLVQVKYEMLRRVRADDVSVTQAAAEAGVSRPTFYEARTNFDQEGIAGLVPKKRGPRGPHKLRPEVLEFLQERVTPGQPIRARELARELVEVLGVDVHPRTLERALGASKKKRRRSQ